jgi:hypothetical protein
MGKRQSHSLLCLRMNNQQPPTEAAPAVPLLQFDLSWKYDCGTEGFKAACEPPQVIRLLKDLLQFEGIEIITIEQSKL